MITTLKFVSVASPKSPQVTHQTVDWILASAICLWICNCPQSCYLGDLWHRAQAFQLIGHETILPTFWRQYFQLHFVIDTCISITIFVKLIPWYPVDIMSLLIFIMVTSHYLIKWWPSALMNRPNWMSWSTFFQHLLVLYHIEEERSEHTAYSIVSWPNPK